MALEWVRVSLRAWRPGGIAGPDVFEILRLEPEAGFESRLATTVDCASLIQFAEIQIAEPASDEDEPSTEFSARLGGRLLAAAAWIESRQAGSFERCRKAGLEIDVFIGGWIDQDQMDLTLPAEFLRACGNSGLSISLMTND